MEAAGGRADLREQFGLGRRHPHLAAAFQPGEQSSAPGRIWVGGDFVEQQDRGRAAAGGDELGLGEDDAEEQRLLFAGRAARGGLAFGNMSDGEVLAVRADGGAAGGGIAAARGF